MTGNICPSCGTTLAPSCPALFDKYNPCILAVLLTSRAHLESFMHEYLIELLMMGEMLCSAEQIALKLAVVSQSVQVSNYYHIWHAMGFP